MHDDDVIGSTYHQPDIVLDQQHADLDGERFDQRRGFLRLAVAHALGRLVEQQDFRLAGGGDRDFEAALLAMRQLAGRLARLGRKPEPLQQFIDAGLRLRLARTGRHAIANGIEHLRRQPQVFGHRQFEEQIGDLERAREPGCQHAVGRLRGAIHALDQHLAVARTQCPGDQVEQRRFAGAVRPDHGGDAIARDDEADVVDGAQTAEMHGEIADFQDRRGHGRRSGESHRAIGGRMMPIKPLGRKTTAAMNKSPITIRWCSV